MDLGLHTDITESFRIFQGRVLEQYDRMVPEFGFTMMDATLPVHEQQELVREVIQDRIDLALYQKRFVQ
jgi:dTMP kinase